MTEIALNNVEKYYGATQVLRNITLEVQTGERVGLIGRNGSGKTTILKMIAGREKHDGGLLVTRKNATMSYLDQIPDHLNHKQVEDVLKDAFATVLRLKESITQLEEEMAGAKGEKLEKVMRLYQEVCDRFESGGGYRIEEQVNAICEGLRIHADMRSREFGSLSGGEKTTVILGKILLEHPDILLLDEPTNHLDLEAVEWFEEFISAYRGTVLAISHDRYFLDRVVSRIVEIEDGEAEEYHGNYSFYSAEKERRQQVQFEQYKDQQKKIKAMREAIHRFREWGTRANDEAMFKKAANMEKRIERMEKVERPVMERATMKLTLSGGRSGNDVLVAQNLTKSFGGSTLFREISLHICYGEKVALLGRNGSGKSTLIRLLLQQTMPDTGEVKIGSRVQVGYLEQNVVFPDERQSVIELFREHFPMHEGEARGKLARFLFYGNAVFRSVGSLSGGEKTRLKLCLLVHQNVNLLVLDEPTNHLDIDAREVLEEVLQGYEGTVLFISHDRYFINRVAGRIVELGNGRLAEYEGNYEYYKRKRAEWQEFSKPIEREKSQLPLHRDKRTANEEKKKQRAIAALEEEITQMEERLAALDKEIEHHAANYVRLTELCAAKGVLEQELEKCISEWEILNG